MSFVYSLKAWQTHCHFSRIKVLVMPHTSHMSNVSHVKLLEVSPTDAEPGLGLDGKPSVETPRNGASDPTCFIPLLSSKAGHVDLHIVHTWAKVDAISC